jgi:hypothetical protein
MEITCWGFLVFFSCQLPEKPPQTDSFCLNYRPIYMRHSWPRDAKEAVDKPNRVWKALRCGASRTWTMKPASVAA